MKLIVDFDFFENLRKIMAVENFWSIIMLFMRKKQKK